MPAPTAIEEMDTRLEELNEHAIQLQAQADAEKRDLTTEEQEALSQRLDEYETLEAQIKQRRRLDEQTRRLRNPEPIPSEDGEGQNRKTEPDIPGRRAGEFPESGSGSPEDRRAPIRVTDRALRDPRWGWRSFGEFGNGVIEACRTGGSQDDRFTRAALATYGSEAIGADGGFAVPPDFRNIIKVELEGEESLLARTDQQTSSSNNLTVPKDETTPWQTSGGIQMYWVGEGGTITQSKPALETVSLKLHKAAVLVPLTDELMADSQAMTGWLTTKVPQKIVSGLNLVIVQGTGAGQPLGILNAGHTVSVAKVGSQVADTVVGLNIINMWSRMYAPWRRNAVWLINQDIEPQLLTLMKQGRLDTGAVDTGWGAILYVPAGGLSGAPFATLFGRPVIPVQACETLGDKGDIIFAALDQYVTVQKTTGLRQDISIHLWFDQDAVAFRFIMRLAGQPWYNTTIASRDGSTTYSAFVTLDERA